MIRSCVQLLNVGRLSDHINEDLQVGWSGRVGFVVPQAADSVSLSRARFGLAGLYICVSMCEDWFLLHSKHTQMTLRQYLVHLLYHAKDFWTTGAFVAVENT